MESGDEKKHLEEVPAEKYENGSSGILSVVKMIKQAGSMAKQDIKALVLDALGALLVCAHPHPVIQENTHNVLANNLEFWSIHIIT